MGRDEIFGMYFPLEEEWKANRSNQIIAEICERFIRDQPAEKREYLDRYPHMTALIEIIFEEGYGQSPLLDQLHERGKVQVGQDLQELKQFVGRIIGAEITDPEEIVAWLRAREKRGEQINVFEAVKVYDPFTAMRVIDLWGRVDTNIKFLTVG